jgi:hypothetical protein
MSGSAIQTSTYQALAQNIYNADKTTPIYNGGWDFKNASGTTTFAVSSAGVATISSQAGTNGDPTLIVQGANNRERIQVRSYNGGDPVVSVCKIAGTLATPTATLSGTDLGTFQLGGYDGTAFIRSAWMSATATENWSGSARGSSLYFSATPNGSTTIQKVGEVTGAGAWTLGPSTFAGTHTIRGTVHFTGAGAIVLSSNVIGSGAGTHFVKWNSSSGFLTYDTSSRLVKTDIVDCPYGLDAVMQLSPRKYLRTDDPKSEVGFIADEVVGVIPEIVPTVQKSLLTKNEADTEQIPGGVNYDRLTAVLVKALQEQQAMIEELKAKVAALEAK